MVLILFRIKVVYKLLQYIYTSKYVVGIMLANNTFGWLVLVRYLRTYVRRYIIIGFLARFFKNCRNQIIIAVTATG